MKTIYKYPLLLEGAQTLDLPALYQILDVQFQGEQLCLWALVNNDVPLKTLQIRIYGTGSLSVPPSPGHHLATVQQGPYVWHIFAKE